MAGIGELTYPDAGCGILIGIGQGILQCKMEPEEEQGSENNEDTAAELLYVFFHICFSFVQVRTGSTGTLFQAGT